MKITSKMFSYIRFSQDKKHNLESNSTAKIKDFTDTKQLEKETVNIEEVISSDGIEIKKSAKERDRERLRKKSNKKKEKEKRKVARTTKATIPYEKMDKYNITKVDKGLYSKTYKFTDINYKIAKHEDKEGLFLEYLKVLNYFSTSMDIQVTILNERIDQEEFSRKLIISNKNDFLDEYRDEYNQILKSKLEEGSNDVVQNKYLTITVREETVLNAKNKFDSIEAQIIASFEKMDSKIVALNSIEKITIFKNIYRGKDVLMPEFTQNDFEKQVQKNFISPDYFEFKKDYFMFDNKYARSIFLRDIGTFLSDEFLSEITDLSINMLVSVNMFPIEPAKARKLILDKISIMKMNRGAAQKKLNKAGYSTDMVSDELEESLEEAKELFHSVSQQNQKLFLTNVIITIIADDYDQLNLQTKDLQAVASKSLCNFTPLHVQQEKGFTSSLPIGKNMIDKKRTQTSESTAVFIPFKAKDLIEENGSYYGMNPVNNNLIALNRKLLKNSNGFIFGMSGSGKSFTAKREMINVILNTNDDVIVIDPENEYSGLITNMGGESIDISATSTNHINPLDMSSTYNVEGDPFIFKSEFIMSLCEVLITKKHGNALSGQESIIDRCLKLTYAEYLKEYDNTKIPTLKDFHKVLLKQNEPIAKAIALELEIYTTGSLSVFAKKTNIKMDSRLTSFNITNLGDNLKTMGILIVLDYIWNRVSKNKDLGKNTWIFIDECHVLFNNEHAENFLEKLYKQIRKRGGIPTGITQNIEDLLLSDKARSMLSNSQFIQMLSQSQTNKEALADLLNLSDEQATHINSNATAGNGLIFYGGQVIPFKDNFPTNTKLYELMSTNFNERQKLKQEA